MKKIKTEQIKEIEAILGKSFSELEAAFVESEFEKHKRKLIIFTEEDFFLSHESMQKAYEQRVGKIKKRMKSVLTPEQVIAFSAEQEYERLFFEQPSGYGGEVHRLYHASLVPIPAGRVYESVASRLEQDIPGGRDLSHQLELIKERGMTRWMPEERQQRICSELLESQRFGELEEFTELVREYFPSFKFELPEEKTCKIYGAKMTDVCFIGHWGEGIRQPWQEVEILHKVTGQEPPSKLVQKAHRRYGSEYRGEEKMQMLYKATGIKPSKETLESMGLVG